MNHIWLSDDGRFFLDGPNAFRPGTTDRLLLTYPLSASPPKATLRFIPSGMMPDYLAGRDEGALPYPDDLSRYAEVRPRVTTRRLGASRGQLVFSFQTDAHEGLYLFMIQAGSGARLAAEMYVVIASRKPSSFPAPGVEDLTDVIVPHVNASDKNARLYLVMGAVWFAENMLNITISDALKAQIAASTGAPPYAPVTEETARQLVAGRQLAGIHHVWLVDQCDDDSPPGLDLTALRDSP